MAKATTDKTTKVDVQIKSIRVYSNGDDVRYRVELDKEIDAIKVDRETGEYGEAKVDYIDFVPSVIIAQCLNKIEGLDLLYTKKKEQSLRSGVGSGFGAAELSVTLRGAKITLARTRFEAGDEYQSNNNEVGVYEHAGYSTEIVSIKVSDRVQTKLDDILDSMFSF